MSVWREREAQFYMQAVRRQPLVIVRGEGAWVWDEEDRQYLDFTAGWGVNCLGHCHPAITDAIATQARTLVQTSNQFYTIPQLRLAQRLVESSGLDRVFLCNSGAEAVEGAVKLARKYGRAHRRGAYEVITALDSFHGRTLAMTAATGQPRHQEAWQPLSPGFVNVPFDDVRAIREATTDLTCAVMLEPVQGEGGVNVPSPGYLRAVREWCDEAGLLLVLDEVQTGMGRLGRLFGYEWAGVEPHAVALAKGLGGGVPIGAFLARERCAVLEPGDHGSTFGGNALTSAAAAAALDHLVENDVPTHAAAMGEALRQGLQDIASRHDAVKGVRGAGLLLGLELNRELSREVVAACNGEGVLLNPVRPHIVRLMPPLTITREETEEGLERIERGLVRALAESAANPASRSLP